MLAVQQNEGGRSQLTAGAVEETVTGLDGIVNDISGDGVVDLPETEAHLGHVVAAVELDYGGHCDGVFCLMCGMSCQCFVLGVSR